MAIFNTNQNRHFFVATDYNATVTDASSKGTIGNVKVTSGDVCPKLYFLYKGVDGVTKSDLIQINNIDYIKLVDHSKMQKKMRKIKIVLNSAVNSGNPVAGQDYVLRIAFRQFFGMSDENQYFKDASVRATAAMAADKKEFYKAMVAALNQSFAREVGATASSNPYLSFYATTTPSTPGSEDGIYIEEKPQDWVLGIRKQERVLFDVFPTTIFYNGGEEVWANYVDDTGKYYTELTPTTTVGNGKDIADLEWFCMGERGDQYRGINYPDDIKTEYMVDTAAEYDVLEIHHAFTDTGVNSYKSEKDITIVATVANKAALTSLKEAIEAYLPVSNATMKAAITEATTPAEDNSGSGSGSGTAG